MKQTMIINLNHNQTTIINKEDYHLICGYKWRAIKSSSGKYYAVSQFYDKKSKKVIRVYMHRLILNPTGMTDHINRNSLDNRKENLRSCTLKQNFQNSKKLNSRYKGVIKRKNYYMAKFCVDGKETFLGSYVKEKDAALAYDREARKTMTEFTYLNFPEITDYSCLNRALSPVHLIKGVRKLHKSRKWEARIQINGKRKTIGIFNSKKEAIAAYKQIKLDILNEK